MRHDLFPDAPRIRRARRVMMHVVDAGCDLIHFKCRKCGHDNGWVPERKTARGEPAIAAEKRGRPCPKCNNLPADGELTMGDF